MGLTAYVGWPLPTTIPTIDEIQLALRSGIDPQLLDEVVVGSVVCHQGEIRNARVREAHGLSPLNTPQEA